MHLFFWLLFQLFHLYGVAGTDWPHYWTHLARIDHAFLDVNYDYELLKFAWNGSESEALLATIKRLRVEVSMVAINATAAISTTDWTDLYHQAMFQVLSKTCDAYVAQLDGIAIEVLGVQANLTPFQHTRHSVRLDFTLALYYGWWPTLQAQLKQLNQSVQERTLRATIQALLDEILGEMDKYRTELEVAYYEESDSAHIDEMQLSKVQQRRAEEALDSLTALNIYLKHYWAVLQLYCG